MIIIFIIVEVKIWFFSICRVFAEMEIRTVKVSIVFRYKRTGIEDGFYFTVG